MVSGKRKAVKDSFLNMIGFAIPLGLLQLGILPLVSSTMDSASYGLVLTIVSFYSLCPGALGGAINNIRLIRDGEYEASRRKGDFGIIFIGLVALNVMIMVVLMGLYEQPLSLGYVLVIATSILWLFQAYFSVAYLIEINYAKVLVNQLFLAFGYVVGTGVYILGLPWETIYLFGQAFACVHIVATTKLWKEPLKKTPFFTESARDTLCLVVSSGLARFITYADRLLLYPLLGGTMVSIYYVATLFGKIFSMIIAPINGVLLTYLSKYSTKPNKAFRSTLLSGSVLCFAGYFVIVFVSRFALGILYPQFAGEAMPFIGVTTATALISGLTTLVSPFVIKFFDMKWQIVMWGTTSILYVAISFALATLFGLWGFCVAALTISILQFLMNIFVYAFAKERL